MPSSLLFPGDRGEQSRKTGSVVGKLEALGKEFVCYFSIWKPQILKKKRKTDLPGDMTMTGDILGCHYWEDATAIY